MALLGTAAFACQQLLAIAADDDCLSVRSGRVNPSGGGLVKVVGVACSHLVVIEPAGALAPVGPSGERLTAAVVA
jgi:hypothetical protein